MPHPIIHLLIHVQWHAPGRRAPVSKQARSLGGIVITFGDYNLLGLLASGGMSDVYLAEEHVEELSFRRRVALKLMHQDTSTPLSPLFLRDEAVSLGPINHPNVVQLLRIGRRNDHLFMAMELLEGITLKHIFTQLADGRPPLPFGFIAALVKQICEGAHAAHEAVDSRGRPLRLVHRDLKPANVMMTKDGLIKVIDFGIALSSTRLRQTRPGGIVGTAAYMSPEQTAAIHVEPRGDGSMRIEAEPLAVIDRRTDLWAIGVMLHELCTGERLFAASDVRAILFRVNFAPIPSIRSLRPDIPERLAGLIERLLSRPVDGRPASAAEVAAALRLVVREAGGEFADARALIDYLQQQDYDLTPPRAVTLTPERFACLRRNFGQTTPPPPSVDTTVDDSRVVAVVPPDPAPIVLRPTVVLLRGRVIADGRYRIESPIAQGDEDLGSLRLQWFTATRLEDEVPLRLALWGERSTWGSASDGHRLAFDAICHHLDRLPEASRPFDHGSAWDGGPMYLACREPEQTLATLGDMTLTDRIALARALAGALADNRAAWPDYVHGALAPALVGVSHFGVGPLQLSLDGISLAVIAPDLVGRNDESTIGPPHPFRAPELARDLHPTPATDVYAAGMLIYALLGGDPHRAATEARPPRLRADVELTPAVERAVFDALSPDPSHRPAAAALHDRLVRRVALPRRRIDIPPDGQTASFEHGGTAALLHTLVLTQHSRLARELPFPVPGDLAPRPMTVRLLRGVPIIELHDDATDAVPGTRQSPRLYQMAHRPASRLVRVDIFTAAGRFDYGHRDHGVLTVRYRKAQPDEGDVPPMITLPDLSLELCCPANAVDAVALWATAVETGCLHIIILVLSR